MEERDEKQPCERTLLLKSIADVHKSAMFIFTQKTSEEVACDPEEQVCFHQ